MNKENLLVPIFGNSKISMGGTISPRDVLPSLINGRTAIHSENLFVLSGNSRYDLAFPDPNPRKQERVLLRKELTITLSRDLNICPCAISDFEKLSVPIIHTNVN